MTNFLEDSSYYYSTTELSISNYSFPRCPVYLYLGKVAYGLKSDLSPYQGKVGPSSDRQDRTWVLNNVMRLSNLVAASFVLFGKLSMFTSYIITTW
jgi:hypothetical protein